MSDPTVDGGAPPREKASFVLGAIAVLALAAWLAWVVADHRTRSVDAAETLAAWFEPRELPFGFAAREAAVEPRGDEVLVLAAPSAAPEPPRVEPPKRDPSKKLGEDRFDWAKVPVGERDQPPLEAALVRLPHAIAVRELEGLMKGAPELRGDFDSVPPQGGRRTIDRGKLAWREFDCDFVHEREFEPGGTFRDTLRANLTQPGAPMMFLARWPRGTPASVRRAEELLAALVPRS
jgi:hypothetical protein